MAGTSPAMTPKRLNITGTPLMKVIPTSIPGVGSFDVQRLTLFNANGRRSEVAVAGDLSNVYDVAAFSAPVVSVLLPMLKTPAPAMLPALIL